MMNIWDKFHEHGIEIPYPQRDIHIHRVDSHVGSINENDFDESQIIRSEVTSEAKKN